MKTFQELNTMESFNTIAAERQARTTRPPLPPSRR